jgi:single-strand DNA-binding protein
MSLNKVQLIGHLGQNPEIRKTNDGKEIANFSIATSESWKDKQTGERKSKSEWHRVVVFSQGLVGIIKQYVKKGSKLYIEGALQTRKWTDKDGVDKYTTEIVLQNFNSNLQMLGSKGGNKEQDQNKSIEETARDQFEGSKVVELDDSIPF